MLFKVGDESASRPRGQYEDHAAVVGGDNPGNGPSDESRHLKLWPRQAATSYQL